MWVDVHHYFLVLCLIHVQSWTDVNLLLKEFCPDEQDKIIGKNVVLTYRQGEVGLPGLRLILVGIVIIKQR